MKHLYSLSICRSPLIRISHCWLVKTDFNTIRTIHETFQEPTVPAARRTHRPEPLVLSPYIPLGSRLSAPEFIQKLLLIYRSCPFVLFILTRAFSRLSQTDPEHQNTAWCNRSSATTAYSGNPGIGRIVHRRCSLSI